jgi:hypothetical protein
MIASKLDVDLSDDVPILLTYPPNETNSFFQYNRLAEVNFIQMNLFKGI